MKIKIYFLRFLVIGIVFISVNPLISECRSIQQDPSNLSPKMSTDMSDDTLINRAPAVAGTFYPGSKTELMQMMQKFFSVAVPPKGSNHIVAIICPHAGYVFSGEVAASAYNQIPKGKHYDNIFILGSSHRFSYDYASIYSNGNFITPLGEATVNRAMARKIETDNPELFKSDRSPHINEHCIEVQIPFLQYLFKDSFQIIPILLGTQKIETCEKLAVALKPYFNEKNLFIISSDFSHYPDYKDANLVDAETANSITRNSSSAFLETIEKHEKEGYPELVTSACGWTSILTLLYISEGNKMIKYQKVQYKNSADSPYGEKNRVVGYNAIQVSINSAIDEKHPEINHQANFSLTDEDKSQLLKIARQSIAEYLKSGKTNPVKPDLSFTDLMQKTGAFVTLNKEGELRGCIGRFETNHSLYEVVQEMAIAAASKDSRFLPVSKEELTSLDIEISVLTPMHKIQSIKEIELGKHGIYIRKNLASGTFLPQVAIQTGWSLEEFLGHCARDKAGLGWDGWKDADIYTYEAIVFGEKKTIH